MGVMFAAVIVGFATRRPTKNSTPSKYEFEYYPKANIYYNKTIHTYAFLDKNGAWQTQETPPLSTIPLDKKVELESSSPEIWKDNDKHRMIYAASLYASESDLKETEKKPEPPVVKIETFEVPKVVETKKAHGLKGFLKKIFKKKKDTTDSSSINK
ncbi:MAG: hypothetical protein ACJ749_14320 [Flavisolibacter sp.]